MRAYQQLMLVDQVDNDLRQQLEHIRWRVEDLLSP